MNPTLIDTMDTMLQAVQADVSDPEATFRIRTVRQLLVVLETRLTAGKEALADVSLDPETEARLRRLGYLD